MKPKIKTIKLNVNVIEVKYAPGIGKVEMMGGIRTKEAAACWADKNGYATVYWLKSHERVYADRLIKNVGTLAKKIEQKSDSFLRQTESGQALLGAAFWVALVLFVLLVLLKDQPW